MSKKPDFFIYNVNERKDQDDFWYKLAAGFKFQTEDGRMGINFPNLRMVILEPKKDKPTPKKKKR